MPSRYAATFISPVIGDTGKSTGSNYVIQTLTGVLYIIYVDTSSDLVFRKSLDGGLGWGRPTVIFTGTVVYFAVWYDRWSGIAGDLIHCAYTDSGIDDTLYRTIDAANADALSTETTIFAGASTAAGGHLSIARSRGGNVYCKTVIDAGAEGGFFRLPNANVPNGAWDAARTIDEAVATNDAMHLLPGFAADNQDMLAIFWDTSANEISRKTHDDSANTWAETSIATSMTKQTGATAYPSFAIAVDLTNTQVYLVAWSAVDTANADLRFWTIDEGAITEGTNVIQNSTDDQGQCSVGFNTENGRIIVLYGGLTAGSDTWPTAHVYARGSSDGGTTWSAESAITEDARTAKPTLTAIWLTPRFTGQWTGAFVDDTTIDQLHAVLPITLPAAQATVVI